MTDPFKKKYTFEEVEKIRREEMIRFVTILNYLLNIHSKPLPEGLDYVKAYEAIEDYEHYLWETL